MVATLLGLLAMLGLAALRVPMALAMAAVGFVGLGLLRSWQASATSATQMVFEAGLSYTLSVIPMFIFMGGVVARSGMAQDLFAAAHALVGRLKGGLAMTAIVASAGFGAVCGSSIATTATMSRVAVEPMRSHRYSDGLLTGSIAAGGTLGILIPPSSIMIIYGIMTENNIASLFAAGIVPGIALTLLYCGVAYLVARSNGGAVAAPERLPIRATLSAFRKIWAVLLLFVVVMGGMYAGFFTATEGAGVGAFGALSLAVIKRDIAVKELGSIAVESARSSAMLFAVIIGATIFGNFVNYTSMAQDISALIKVFDVGPTSVILAICVIYLVLGMAMEELTMVLLTLPMFYPIVIGLGFDPIWFGTLIVLVVMFGMISPPVGMVLFVIKNLVPNVPTATVFKGVIPFLGALLLMLGLLIAFPQIALFLPQRLFP